MLRHWYQQGARFDETNVWRVYSFPIEHRKLMSIGISSLCWTIWKTRNDACFQCKFLRDPANLFFSYVLLV